jgi:uracil phosphoribosyltransferase
VFILSDSPSVANHFLAQLRDKQVQTDRMRFRKNLERLGELLAYEISKKLPYVAKEVNTPLGVSRTQVLQEPPVLIAILRAALPFYQGFLNVFEEADSGFVGAYRVSETREVEVRFDYLATPDITGRQVILTDTMLASGRSLIQSVQKLLTHGRPAHIHFASVVAAPEGIDYISRNTPVDFSIWTCAKDEKLNSQAYIVPGLGDAGDLAFGPKL